MALGSHPLFLESATKTGSSAKRPKVDPTPQEYEYYGVTFTMQAQTESNWCWAAATASISHFYLSTSAWTQCTIANDALGRNDCCTTPTPGLCNVTCYYEDALSVTGNYDSMGSPAVGTVVVKLIAGRPVGATLTIAGGGAHGVVISSWMDFMGDEWFGIEDPAGGFLYERVIALQNGTYGQTWVQSYYTKAAP